MGAVANAASLASNSTFRNMALAGMVYTARIVLNESNTTPNHDRRLWLARAVVASPSVYLDSIAWAMATDPAIAVATTVAQVDETVLLNTIATAWDAIAGIGVITVH